jgi:hypothetical protein
MDKFENMGAQMVREGVKAVAAGMNPMDLIRTSPALPDG